MNMRSLILVLFVSAAVSAVAQDPITIAEAKKQEFGTTVSKIAGRVTAAGQIRYTVYFQDATAGIAIYNSTISENVNIGDSIIVENAVLEEFGNTAGAPGTGQTQLGGTDLKFTIVPVDREEPVAALKSIPLVGENEEGLLIRLRRVKFLAKGAFKPETNYDVEDSQGNLFFVRINGATNIATNSLPIPEETVDVIGCVSQFRGAYQLFPRFAEDIGLSVEEDTVSRSRTLDITTWNLDWYGSTDTTRGPSDKDRQTRSIRRVLDSTGADIYALQEVLTQEALDALSDSIQGTYANILAVDVTSDQKMAYIYNTETITPVTHGLAVNGGSQAWANGRYPFRLTFDANIQGATRRMVIFNIHGKATSDSTAQEDYQRRKTDAETFHQYLEDFYADTSLFVMGDFNDVLTKSVVDSTLPSPYQVFLDDDTRWWSPTFPLEERGLNSYVGFNQNFLDHALITTDMEGFHHRTFVEVPQAYLPAYSSTVSDHVPVTTRYYLDPTVSVSEGIAPQGAQVRLAPNPMVDHGTAEITVPDGGTVRVDLVNTLGITTNVLQETMAPQIRVVSLPVNTLTSGAYILRIEIDGVVTTRPVIIAR